MNEEQKAKIIERVRLIICEMGGIKFDTIIKPETTMEDLGLDSLDQIEIVMALEDEFDMGIEDSVGEQWTKYSDVCDYVIGEFS